MSMVNDVKPASVAGTVTFRLGVLGTAVADRFAAAIQPLDLKPKHVGLMVVLDTRGAGVQLEIARTMGVAPSLVVSLADHLERLGAIARVRDAGDRRRQLLSLTKHGRELLRDCHTRAQALDEELLAGIGADDRAVLRRVLGGLAADAGLP
ncbi:MarR family winged helix-turn-helix transcriptional regulator [Streptosporangium roseum]|uniref:MarR family transcriptional regulator n=1 Tax=Streptosporangium roseum (strain ATCC 12428 / DSM 43021 / JCM 3005 / KCTC 9067 / NCIMB 10171 / NRRL 2505 / NI 9100) TaxID=479432 RepID=D2AZQ3_STRRD|nr:MarR family transcriptional regulator [Streptosporangium roseum]ACZ85298.1 MarR family transcriptional regulator [Streptosporangium roseum DSM 43021]